METKIDFFEGGNVDVKGFVNKILSRWYLFAACITVCVVGALVFLKTAPVKYNVGASLLIREENSQSLKGTDNISSLNIFASNKNLENEMGIIRSHKLIRSSLDRLHFQVSYHSESFWKAQEEYASFPYEVRVDTSYFQLVEVPMYIEAMDDSSFTYRMEADDFSIYRQSDRASRKLETEFVHSGVGKFGKPCQGEYYRFTVNRTSGYEDQSAFEGAKLFVMFHDIDAMAENYRDRLSIENINIEATLVELGLEGVGSKEVAFLNAHCEEYILSNLREKNQMAARTIDFIDGQLFSVGDSLQRVQGQMESFQRKENTINLEMTAQNSMEQLTNLQNEYSQLMVKDEYYRYLLAYLQDQKDPNAIVAPASIGVNDPQLTKMIGELRQFNAEKVELSYSAGTENYDLQILNSKIENVQGSLVENVKGIISSSEISIRDIERRVENAQKVINRLPQSERNLINLRRRFALNDNLYNFLLQKRAEAGIAIASNSANIKVVDDARIIGGKPSSPKKLMILALAIALGCFFPLLWIVIQDLWSDKITSAASMLHDSKISILARITHANKTEAKVIYRDLSSPLAESFRYLWLNLNMVRTGKKEAQVIGLSSYSAGEGKSFCASNLATIGAVYGKRVLLIEADLRRPSLLEKWSLPPKPGLAAYLKGDKTLEEAISATPIDKLEILFSGGLCENPAGLLAGPGFEKLIQKAREEYDYIVIDSPPIGLVSDYIVIGRYTDLDLLVVRENHSLQEAIDELSKYAEGGLIPNANWLLNDVQTNTDGYTYGYYRRPSTKSKSGDLQKFWEIFNKDKGNRKRKGVTKQTF